MQAGEVRAGERSHVHHIIVYIKEPQAVPGVVSIRPILEAGAQFPRPAARPAPQAGQASPAQALPAGSRGGDNMLVNWAVGEDAPVFQPGMAKRIPAGSTLVFQVQTNGNDRGVISNLFSNRKQTKISRSNHLS